MGGWLTGISNLNADKITRGTVDGDRLPAISTTKKGAVPATGTLTGKYLKDDGTWATPEGAGHAQGTDQGLDMGGINAVTAEQTKTAYTHSQSSHAPTDAVTLSQVKSDTDIASTIGMTHAPTSDNQDLSGLQPKETGKGLSANDLTNSLKSNYDSAYSHSQSAHAPSGAQKNSDITKAEIEAKLTGEISTHTHTGGSDPWTVVKLTQDFVTSLAANTNVTGFNFTPASNKTYLIYGTFMMRTATATVGGRPGIAWPTGLTDATARMEASTALTTSVIRSWGAINTQNATSTGFADTTSSHYGGLEALLVCGGSMSGNFQITLASETAGTNVTMRAGSYFMYREI